MAITGSNTGLKRKMEASREDAAATGRSAAGALRLAMARAADDVFDLAVSVIGATHTRVGQDELGRHLSDDRLQILLDGPDGQLGALTLDRAFLVALIQQQTMGRLTGGAPDERPFTGTDAALTAPLIDAMLRQACELADRPQDRQCLSGFRFGARGEDARTIVLAMEADRFRVFDLTFEFGGGPEQGALCLILPEPDKPARSQPSDAADPSAQRMGAAVEMARADLTAVICRMRIPLADLSAMQEGDMLPLLQEHMDRTDLVSILGKKVATGRLGQINGMRALRLNETRLPRHNMPDTDGFAADIGAQSAMVSDPMTVDGNVVPQESPETDSHGPPSPQKDDASGETLGAMTPQEAAQSISDLAGIGMDDDGSDAEDAPQPVSIG
ncbi:FliM/FliN family flagellar motor switch protein [Rhodobacteraceae bacterium F11138]|nr:FliM/FliN family flagellar motor switch protein [Rhodobacteraceae bacterium F11138]